ncbi:MAG: glycosyltransferase family 2 protein [Leptodesmis sp.]|uniref:glycosyltransferase family 2 protein n=1 Tax=Leptodesmis sp. TaxID=3100501 RepID=UPI003D140086
MSNPRFTFCIPNLNKFQYLPACIESMLAQDCEDWQCVFVDGYSTDGSWEYMQQFASDPRFLLLRGLKQGMYADWNECLRHVDTEYFYFLTSDDACFPSLVSTTVRALDAYPTVDACHFQFCLINELGEMVQSSESITRQECDLYCEVNHYPHLRSGICEFMMHFAYRAIYTTITSLVFRRNLLNSLKGFKTTCGVIADYDWTMRSGLFTDVLYIPKLLATWRVYAEQATRSSDRLENQATLLAIAQENLNYFLAMKTAQKLKQPIRPDRLLADFQNHHAAAIYHQLLSSRTGSELQENVTLLISNYPLYLVKKALNRLSFNRLYPYPKRIELAQSNIDRYGLQWPPLKVSL